MQEKLSCQLASSSINTIPISIASGTPTFIEAFIEVLFLIACTYLKVGTDLSTLLWFAPAISMTLLKHSPRHNTHPNNFHSSFKECSDKQQGWIQKGCSQGSKLNSERVYPSLQAGTFACSCAYNDVGVAIWSRQGWGTWEWGLLFCSAKWGWHMGLLTLGIFILFL